MALKDEELRDLIGVNLRADTENEYDDEDLKDIVVSPRVTAFPLRATEPCGKAALVNQPDSLTPNENSYVSAFPDIAPKSMLVCAASVLNHYAIKHTTGQGKLQGFVLNAARELLLLNCQ